MISTRSFLVAFVGLIETLLLAGAVSHRPPPTVIEDNLDRLPMEIAGYRGSDDSFAQTVNQVLDTDVQVYRHYLSAQGEQVDLYVGYYGTAKGGRTGHNPYACLPGAGWAIVDFRDVDIQTGDPSREVTVNYLRARKNETNVVMLHWYQGAGGRVMATGIEQNIERFKSRLLRKRNDGAYVQVATQVSDQEVLEAALRVEDFAGEILGLLPDYWPVEQ